MDNNQFLLNQVKQSLTGVTQVLLAFSGGVDSVVLLHTLVAIRQQRSGFSVRALYIHHGLSDNASLWGEHCREICLHWNVPFDLVKVQVNAQGSGLEAGARSARYQVFEQNLKPGEVLLTAQHLDDQCETFLLALKRGSGPAGLSSMAENQPFGQTRQIRPLLSISRKQIESYARDNQLAWVNDESNFDDRFDRNFLRLRVLLVLQERWPNFPQAVTRSAELCAEQEQLLDELLCSELNGISFEDGSISIAPLQAMSSVKRQALIRRWFSARKCVMPSRQQLQRVWQEVALSREDAEPQLLLGNNVVRRFRQRLYLLTHMQDISQIELSWDGENKLELPDWLGQLSLTTDPEQPSCRIRAPKPNEDVLVRFSAHGDIRIVGRKHSRSIKKLWQEFAVPPWQRGRIPLIYFGHTLICAVGVFITLEGEVKDERSVWSVVWHKKQAV